MAKGLWTPAQHTHKPISTKLLTEDWKHTIAHNVFVCCSYHFPSLERRGPKHVQARQSELCEDTFCQVWSRKTQLTCTEP